MKIKSILIAGAATMASMLASCSSDTPHDTIYEQSFLNCYAIVTDLNNPDAMTISTPVTMKWTTNWTKMTAEATISGLNINNAVYPTITVSDVPWGAGQWNTARSTNPAASLSTGAPALISDFTLSWLDRLDFGMAIGNYDPGLTYSFIIDGRYKVEGSRSPIALGGLTESVPREGVSFTTTKALYSFVFDFSTRLVELRLVNIQFSDMMPQMSQMSFPGIPFTVNTDGSFSLQCESLIPCIGTTPYPSFPITDLKATVTPGTGATLKFVCTFKEMPYDVTVTLDYTSYQDAISN